MYDFKIVKSSLLLWQSGATWSHDKNEFKKTFHKTSFKLDIDFLFNYYLLLILVICHFGNLSIYHWFLPTFLFNNLTT